MVSSILHHIAAHPWVYDQIQGFFGIYQIHDQLQPYLAEAQNKTILDVGAGTGLAARIVPATARYIWLDNDTQKLEGFSANRQHQFSILSDATQIALRNKSVDVALCVNVTHHLPDAQAEILFSELARVVRQRLLFWEPLLRPDSLVSNLLWKYDRGSYPRSAGVLQQYLARHFIVEHTRLHTIYHQYLLCVAQPKP